MLQVGKEWEGPAILLASNRLQHKIKTKKDQYKWKSKTFEGNKRREKNKEQVNEVEENESLVGALSSAVRSFQIQMQ
jgi:hypothetical protein